MNKTKLFLILFGAGFVAVVGGAFLLTAGRNLGQVFFGRSFAESELRDYVSSVLREEINGARCQAVDSDGNGYVSCDYTLNSSPGETRSIECAAWGWDGLLNRGCRSRFPNFPSR